MAFKKRNIAVGNLTAEKAPSQALPRGTKRSLLTSQPVTSTGTASLDSILGGHGGLTLGCSLLIEESGTTDFAGSLLRYFAAQGICNGHVIHVVGVDESWMQSLPAVVDGKSAGRNDEAKRDAQKMKIAWRYENLGVAADRASARRMPSGPENPADSEIPFCHTFDLSKRLTIPQNAVTHFYRVSPSATPFDSIIHRLEGLLKSSPPDSIQRLIIPSILSPVFYPPHASRPENFIRFLHSLRSLLRRYPDRLVAILSLPLELYQRTSGVVRWAEVLSDGVLELKPFPHLMDSANLAESGGARNSEDQPQGLLRVAKLPINTERSEGGAGAENSIAADLAFTVSRRKFVIKPFSLPPLEAQDDQRQSEGGKPLTGKDVEF